MLITQGEHQNFVLQGAGDLIAFACLSFDKIFVCMTNCG